MSLLAMIESLLTPDELTEARQTTNENAEAPLAPRPAHFEEGGTSTAAISEPVTLTRTALRRFLKWSTSRYNPLSKKQAVELAFIALQQGTSAPFVLSCGGFTESSAMTGAEYLIHPEGRYVAVGTAVRNHERNTWTFQATARVTFRPLPEPSSV